MEDFSKFIPYQLKMVMKGLEKQGVDYLARYNISMGQAYILIALVEQNGSTITRVGQRLERDQLVVRRPSSEDRRITLLYITDKGREIAMCVYDEAIKHNDAILAALGDQKAALNEIFRRFETFIDEGYEVSEPDPRHKTNK